MTATVYPCGKMAKKETACPLPAFVVIINVMQRQLSKTVYNFLSKFSYFIGFFEAHQLSFLFVNFLFGLMK